MSSLPNREMLDPSLGHEFTGNYCPETGSKWGSYTSYRLILLMYFLNEAAVLVSPADIAHSAFFIQATIHIIIIVFMGIPIIYSEICVAQYTNCTYISMWNFFPLFRGLGYGMVFGTVLRSMYLNCMSSWYLIYTFYAALDPPPWISCKYFDDDEEIRSSCMVKRVNVSLFQHILDVYTHEHQNLDMYTASFWFFETLIGGNNTNEYPTDCFFQWRAMVAAAGINLTIFTLAINNERNLQIAVKIVLFYIGTVLIILFLVALTLPGSWMLSEVDIDWKNYTIWKILDAMRKSFLTMGSGTGMVVYLSRDASFRSPATMTAVLTSLFGSTICLSFALILFSGIKSMVYYHGGELRVIEQGSSLIFRETASTAEILSYFESSRLWRFMWFSSIFACLLLNIWISNDFINAFVFKNFSVASKYRHSSRLVIILSVSIFSWPFLCSDIFESLVQATYLIQLLTSFCFSLSLYWFYGIKKHSVDITFMIGVKINAYWKIAWLVNPVLTIIFIYELIVKMHCRNESLVVNLKGHDHSPQDEGKWTYFWVTFYTIIGFYIITVIIGVIIEIMYYRYYTIERFKVKSMKWGPRDIILKRSRRIFMPQIMTTEFLYRQVKINGYKMHKKTFAAKQVCADDSSEDLSDNRAWSALTSN